MFEIIGCIMFFAVCFLNIVFLIFLFGYATGRGMAVGLKDEIKKMKTEQ